MISDFLYRNPRILFLVIVVIIVAGSVAYTSLPRLEDPVLSRRVGVVTVVFPGADALQVESQLAAPLEEALREIDEIREIRTTCRTGIVNLVLELSDRVYEVQPIWSRVRDQLLDAENNLPAAAAKPELEVFELKAFAEIVALTGPPGQTPDLIVLRRLAKELKSRIEALAGTQAAVLFGDPGEEIRVEVPPDVMSEMGLTTAAIAQQVASSLSRQPPGYLVGDDSRFLMDVTSHDRPEGQLGRIEIQSGRRLTTQLADLADITHATVTAPQQMASVDGRRALVVAAFVRDRERVDVWASELKSVLSEFREELPRSVVLESIFSQRGYIDERLDILHRNLLQSCAAVVLVILVLMGWRSTVVVALALPLSALMVLSAMRLMEIPIHQMSVTGLIIALGLLIDNAIVIVDEVRSRVLSGLPASRAIREAISHLAMPLFGSTLTTTLAFIPIATLPGPPGEFVGTIAISVILAINASFLLSMTVVPAITARTLRSAGSTSWFSYGLTIDWLSARYASSLDMFLRRPWLGIALAVTLPAGGFWLTGSLPEQFFPPTDRRQIQIELEAPAQASLAQTSARAAGVYDVVTAHAEVRHCHWFLGSSAPTFYYNVVPRRRGAPFYGQALVDLRPDTATGKLVRELQTELDKKFADCRIVVRQLEQGPPFDAPVEIRIFGPDLAVLTELGSDLRLSLSRTKNVVHTRSDLEETIQKLAINVREPEALSAGLRGEDISSQLYVGLQGASAGTIADGAAEIPIRVCSTGAGEMSLIDLSAWPLLPQTRGPPPGAQPGGAPAGAQSDTPRSRTQPLVAVADIELDADLGAIKRINGRRVNEVKAYLVAGTLPSTVLCEFEERLAASDFELPAGYRMQYGGESRERDQAVRNLLSNAVVLIAVIILTLVISFGSFRIAAIITAVGGLAAGLGPGALWLFGFPFGFMAIVGTMGLVGVAINDAIVVMAGIRELSLSGQCDRVEIRNVVMQRSRHVIATTLTTIAGFTPLVLGGGEFWPPLAIAVAGGVAGATLLALYFVPCAFLLIVARDSRQNRR